ncbi:MAG: hypothetical protein IKZ00_04455, partial [Bacteroidaceae bacterium]|nr:hypothetical protein [Bacteroidaceae bacterium]
MVPTPVVSIKNGFLEVPDPSDGIKNGFLEVPIPVVGIKIGFLEVPTPVDGIKIGFLEVPDPSDGIKTIFLESVRVLFTEFVIRKYAYDTQGRKANKKEGAEALFSCLLCAERLIAETIIAAVAEHLLVVSLIV